MRANGMTPLFAQVVGRPQGPDRSGNYLLKRDGGGEVGARSGDVRVQLHPNARNLTLQPTWQRKMILGWRTG